VSELIGQTRLPAFTRLAVPRSISMWRDAPGLRDASVITSLVLLPIGFRFDGLSRLLDLASSVLYHTRMGMWDTR
jgi:hypothetical protein